MAIHEHYQELCALAVVGDLHEDQQQELLDHLETCPECQAAVGQFDALYSMLSDVADGEVGSTVPEGMTQRFVARARSAGIPLAPLEVQAPRRSPIGWPLQRRHLHVFAAAVAILVIAMGSFFAGVRVGVLRNSNPHAPAASAQQVIAPVPKNTPRTQDDAGLKLQLENLQEQLRIASGDLERKKQALATAKAENDSLTSRVTELEASNPARTETEANHTAELQKLKQDLENEQSRRKTAEAALMADEEKLATLAQELKAAQGLTASLAEAHELIVDRNVHVLNVFPEVDASSKSSQPRGRIFYAEGRKLVFYAYDLADPEKITAKASFYLWGEAPKQLVSLGKFQIDSEQQGRWVLRVTDPKLLANVSSVFVTLEPDKKAVAKPTGKRMLSRLLDSKPDNR